MVTPKLSKNRKKIQKSAIFRMGGGSLMYFLRRDLDLNENDKLQANARKKSIMMKRLYDNQLTAQGINRNEVPLDEPTETFIFPVIL